jgi:hypothetical protein
MNDILDHGRPMRGISLIGSETELIRVAATLAGEPRHCSPAERLLL